MGSEPPLILAFDTSAAHCAAALVRGTAVLVRRDEAMDRGQAERLLPMLEEMLAEAGAGWPEISALAVCTGPGNFTGLRLAVAAARGLALALGVPAVGVSRFEALAGDAEGVVLAVVEERRGNLLAQAFRDGVALGAPAAWDPATPGDPARIGPTRTDPAALAAMAARRLPGTVPRPAPFYARPADAAPPAEAPPRILDDAEALAALHALCFTDTPRPWTAAEFATLVDQPAIVLAARPEGFALGRVAGPEAELLTLAVHPEARRQGTARALVAAFEAEAAARGAAEALLDVAATNVAARGLYDSLGYRPAGRRPGYYGRAAGPAVDALILKKQLTVSGR